jgi:hypothetical protein
MKLAMREIVRVLKPGAWATVVFHNTDAGVWSAIRDAAVDAGLVFHEAASLDRRQQSHKGYKGRSGSEDVAHCDVVFNLQKPQSAMSQALNRRPDVDIASLVRAAAGDKATAGKGVQAVHAEVMRRLASTGSSQFVDYSDVRMLYESQVKRKPTKTAVRRTKNSTKMF